MGVLDKILSGGIKGLLKGGKDIVDEFVTTDSERAEAKRKWQSLVNEFKLKQAEQITKRHKHDMKSDSWFSKNIRPFVLAFSLLSITIFAITDGALDSVNIPKVYINLLGQILTAAIAFYFGSRGFEKKKVIDAVRDLKKEREKTLQTRTDIKPKDLPKVSLSPDEK